jgi:hypothetical protein
MVLIFVIVLVLVIVIVIARSMVKSDQQDINSELSLVSDVIPFVQEGPHEFNLKFGLLGE